MAERGHRIERDGLSARDPLPPPSKNICRPLPGWYAKQGHGEVTRNELFVLYEQEFLSSLDDPRDEMYGSGLRRVRPSWEAFRLPARRGPAERPQRARAAARHAGRADERPQLHEGLVVVAGIPRGNERPRERAHFS